MSKPVTCYAVFSRDYKEGKVAVFSWLGWSKEEVERRMAELWMKHSLYEVRPVETYQVEVGDIWRSPAGGPYSKTPWIKVLEVDTRKQQYGQTRVEVLLCEDKEFLPVTCYDVTLFEAYLMLYEEFVESISKEQ